MNDVKSLDFATIDEGRFENREAAGRELAQRLSHVRDEDPVVLGLPRGGVPVAYEVAKELGAPLDVLVVRKLGAPMNPELAIGAIGEGGVVLIRQEDRLRLGIGDQELEAIVGAAQQELDQLIERLRGDREAIGVKGRNVIVVDDGIATGSTVLAAVRVLRERGAARIVLACPVSSPQAVDVLRDQVDELVVLEVPRYLMAVGYHYRDFSPVTSARVSELLAKAGTPQATGSRDDDGHPVDGDGARSGRIVLSGDGVDLQGDLVVPHGAGSLVLFAHGSGSSRLSPRNQQVASALNRAGLATLLFDLLTQQEAANRQNVFDIPLLASRLAGATRWSRQQPQLSELAIGYFGASTGAAAALIAAAALPGEIGALVSRGGRPDLAGDALGTVKAATLLIVGGDDREVLELNRRAAAMLTCEHDVAVIPGATHLFEEPGALEAVSELARTWFASHLPEFRSPPQSP